MTTLLTAEKKVFTMFIALIIFRIDYSLTLSFCISIIARSRSEIKRIKKQMNNENRTNFSENYFYASKLVLLRTYIKNEPMINKLNEETISTKDESYSE
jgi:hypothetical protein